MKQTVQYLFLVFCTLFVFSSCEKMVLDNEESVMLESGNLTVSIYQLEQTSFESPTRASLSDYCTRLNFIVYEMDGTRVAYVNQQSGNSNFGTASFSLDEGDYQLVVLAHSSNGNPTTTNPSKIQFTNATGFTDTFLYSTTITVGEEHQTLNITLNRIVSLCQFVINDAIPDDVARMEFYYTGGSGAFNSATGLGVVNSKQLVKFTVTPGQTGTKYDLYTFLHQEEDDISLKVTAYGTSDNKLYEKTFEIPMERNKITRVSGDFFTGSSVGSGDISISVSINTNWEGQLDISY